MDGAGGGGFRHVQGECDKFFCSRVQLHRAGGALGRVGILVMQGKAVRHVIGGGNSAVPCAKRGYGVGVFKHLVPVHKLVAQGAALAHKLEGNAVTGFQCAVVFQAQADRLGNAGGEMGVRVKQGGGTVYLRKARPHRSRAALHRIAGGLRGGRYRIKRGAGRAARVARHNGGGAGGDGVGKPSHGGAHQHNEAENNAGHTDAQRLEQTARTMLLFGFMVPEQPHDIASCPFIVRCVILERMPLYCIKPCTPFLLRSGG